MGKNVVAYIYNGMLLSYKKNPLKSVPVRWMNLEHIIHVKYIRKRKTSIIYDTYIWNLQR